MLTPTLHNAEWDEHWLGPAEGLYEHKYPCFGAVLPYNNIAHAGDHFESIDFATQSPAGASSQSFPAFGSNQAGTGDWPLPAGSQHANFDEFVSFPEEGISVHTAQGVPILK